MLLNRVITEPYHTVSASLVFKHTNEAYLWYKNVFNPEENMRLIGVDNNVKYAELCIGDSILFLSEEKMIYDSSSHVSDKTKQFYLVVENLDKVIRKASEGGATCIEKKYEDYNGSYFGSFCDPFGYTWMLHSYD